MQAKTNSNLNSPSGKNSQTSDASPKQLNTDSRLSLLTVDELCQSFVDHHTAKPPRPDLAKKYLAELLRRQEQAEAEQDDARQNGLYFKALDALATVKSRRRFLQGILAVSLALAAPRRAEAKSEPDSDFTQRKSPYPDVERQAVVDRFIRKIDDCLIPIERFYSCLLDWNEQSPDQVEGHEVMTLLWDAKEAADELASTIECGDLDHNADELVTRLSGKPLAYLCIKDEIINEVLPPSRLQVEINGFCSEYPQYRNELQTLLWTKQAVRRG